MELVLGSILSYLISLAAGLRTGVILENLGSSPNCMGKTTHDLTPGKASRSLRKK